jgi:NADPH:quinone reductase-like Zn-dependent oxidoreductase
MKAMAFAEFGDPDALQMMDLPDPVAGPGQAVIRVGAVGVNHFDLDIRAGLSRLEHPSPHILGMEFAGEIVSLGTDTDGWSVGDRVTPLYQVACRECPACEAGEQTHCVRLQMYGVQRAGGYAQLALANTRDLVRLPEGTEWETAAAVQLTYGTAWHCLITRAKLQPGETVLISAAGSGVGTAAVQIAKMTGARVIATAGSAEKLERARQNGADEVINYTTENLTERVMELTSGRGVDVAFEHVGGKIFEDTFASVAKQGRITVCGGHAGEVVNLDLIELFRTERTILGCCRASHGELREVLDLVAQGRLHPIVGNTLPLEQAPEAHRLLDDRAAYGKVVLVP